MVLQQKNSKLLNLLGSSLGFTVITHFHRKGLEKLIRSKGSRMLSKWMKPIQISKKLKVMYENSANASLVHRAMANVPSVLEVKCLHRTSP
jgi:hypothetical protein